MRDKICFYFIDLYLFFRVMMMKKILKVEKNPLILSECWTYYKFSIIQTMPNFYPWLTNHIKVYLDKNGNAIFGENGSMYPLSYFFDILNVYDGNLMSVSKKEIVNYLIRLIDSGTYVILDLNYQLINGESEPPFWPHETLIYGYDSDTQDFITSVLADGYFKESRISFSRLEKAYGDIKNYYNEDKNRLFNRRIWYYGITCITPNLQYKNTNAYYDLINKLKWELNGSVFNKYNLINKEEQQEGYLYVTGVACLLYMSELLKEMIERKDNSVANIEKFKKSCTKIYENQHIIYNLIEWFINTQNISNNKLNDLSSMYQKCCNRMLMNVRRFYKYQQKNNDILLEKIIYDLKDLHLCEKKILEQIIEQIQLLCIEFFKK